MGVQGMVRPAAAGVADVLVLARDDVDGAGDDEAAGAVTVAVAVDAATVEGGADDEPLPDELLEHAATASATATVPMHHSDRDIEAPSGSDR